MDNSELLWQGLGGWTTNPFGNDSVGVLMFFKADGTGFLNSENGMVIRILQIRWQILSVGWLRITHLGSPPFILPIDASSSPREPQIHPFHPVGELIRDVPYSLVAKQTSGRATGTNRAITFSSILQLGQSPWPPELMDVRDLPTVFYGHP